MAVRIPPKEVSSTHQKPAVARLGEHPAGWAQPTPACGGIRAGEGEGMFAGGHLLKHLQGDPVAQVLLVPSARRSGGSHTVLTSGSP